MTLAQKQWAATWGLTTDELSSQTWIELRRSEYAGERLIWHCVVLLSEGKASKLDDRHPSSAETARESHKTGRTYQRPDQGAVMFLGLYWLEGEPLRRVSPICLTPLLPLGFDPGIKEKTVRSLLTKYLFRSVRVTQFRPCPNWRCARAYPNSVKKVPSPISTV